MSSYLLLIPNLLLRNVDRTTLLLSHSASQTFNQQHLESYLSLSSPTKYDLSDIPEVCKGVETKSSLQGIYDHSAKSMKDLASRLKILELYCLHVLPRNNEWEYAKEFICMNDAFDEETQDSLLQILQNLRDEKEDGDYGNHSHQSSTKAFEQQQQHQPSGKTGLENVAVKVVRPQDEDQSLRDKNTRSEKGYGVGGSNPSQIVRSPPPHRQNHLPQTVEDLHSKNPRLPSTISSKRKPHVKASFFERSQIILNALQGLVSYTTKSIFMNPQPLLRFVLFLIALIVILGRRDVKDRIRRLTQVGWEKVKRTVGMGVRVSYV